jgi:hypothetical protein
MATELNKEKYEHIVQVNVKYKIINAKERTKVCTISLTNINCMGM